MFNILTAPKFKKEKGLTCLKLKMPLAVCFLSLVFSYTKYKKVCFRHWEKPFKNFIFYLKSSCKNKMKENIDVLIIIFLVLF